MQIDDSCAGSELTGMPLPLDGYCPQVSLEPACHYAAVWSLQTAPDGHLLSGVLWLNLPPARACFLSPFLLSSPGGSNRKVHLMSPEPALRWPCTCADDQEPRSDTWPWGLLSGTVRLGHVRSSPWGLLRTQVLCCVPAFSPLA